MSETAVVEAGPVAERMKLSGEMAQYVVDTLAATAPVIPVEGLLAGPLRRTVTGQPAHPLNGNADNLHFPMDVGNLLQLGVPGIARRARASAAANSGERAQYLLDIARAYEAAAVFIAAHAAEAERQMRGATTAERHRLEAIAANCRALAEGAPRTFAQAVQLFWFIHAVRGHSDCSSTIGRLDQHLYPFYRDDLAAGRVTREEALDLLCELWRALNRQVAHPVQGLMNVMVGGQDAAGNDATNEISVLILEAVLRVGDTNPFVSARIHAGTPRRFIDKVVEVQLTGQGQATVYNDELIIPSLVRYGVPLELARTYANDGCNEVTIDGRSTISLSMIDALKCFELTLFNGADNPSAHQAPRRMLLSTDQPAGYIDAGMLGFQSGDFASMKSFDEFLEAFLKQYFHQISRCLQWQADHLTWCSDHAVSSPVLAGTFRSVLESGLDPNRGGVEVIEQVLFLGSLGTVADGLAAVKKVVFDDKACTPAELLQALSANWEGHEPLRRRCLAAPKFGNDDDYVDGLIAEVIRRTVAHVRAFPSHTGQPVWPCLFNHTFINSAYLSGATPDGRRWMDPVGEHFSPTPGRAVRGPSAVIRSAAKSPLADCVGVAIFHVGLERSLAPRNEAGRTLVTSLLQTAFQVGATVMNIAIYDVPTLREAQAHPERHQDLIVRVWGYSARFVSLSEDMQNHIISRAIQGRAG